MKAPLGSRGLRIDHRACVADALCSDCHSATAHGTAVSWNRTASMDVCIACHAGSQAPRNCDARHANAASTSSDPSGPWARIHGANWKTTHGMGDWRTCGSCHAPEFCGGCHGIGLPHNSVFASQHAVIAAAAPDTCNPCHSEAFCLDCHDTPMPHPAGFTAEHATIVESGGDSSCSDLSRRSGLYRLPRAARASRGRFGTVGHRQMTGIAAVVATSTADPSVGYEDLFSSLARLPEIFRSIPDIIREPSANPVHSVLLLAIFLLAVLIVLVSVMLFALKAPTQRITFARALERPMPVGRRSPAPSRRGAAPRMSELSRCRSDSCWCSACG